MICMHVRVGETLLQQIVLQYQGISASVRQIPLEGMVPLTSLHLIPRVSESIDLEQNPGIYLSRTFPVDTAAL